MKNIKNNYSNNTFNRILCKLYTNMCSNNDNNVDLQSNKNFEKNISIPPIKAEEFLGGTHILFGHPGANKLYKTLKDRINIPNLKKYAALVCSKCLSCQLNKRRYNKVGHMEIQFTRIKYLIIFRQTSWGPSKQYILRIHTKANISTFYLFPIFVQGLRGYFT
ncbi:hypothetical protein DMUE_4610 [Dictyocoela muelleri]|nr:hypothetical protein DMUE_4610 [Dictyocoela muelleri]